jgi:hypothetical protein
MYRLVLRKCFTIAAASACFLSTTLLWAKPRPSVGSAIRAVQAILAVPMKKTDYSGKTDLADPAARECRVKFDLPHNEIEVRYLLLSDEPEQKTATFLFGKNSLKKVDPFDVTGLYMKAERTAWIASARFEVWIKPIPGAIEVRVKADGSGFMNQNEDLRCQFPVRPN